MWTFKKIGAIPSNDNLIAIAGFPGMGLVGKTVVEYVKTYLNAKPIAHIYGYGLPAHLVSNDKGEADILNIEFSFVENNGLGIIIVTSDIQPMSDHTQHSLSKFIVSKLNDLNVKELIAAAAFVSETMTHTRKIYVVGSSVETIEKYVAEGAVPLSGGVISGMNGVIIGWAKFFKINAACLLGETWRSIVEMNYVDYTAAKMIIELVNRVWKLNIDTDELSKKGASIELKVQDIINRRTQKQEEHDQEKRPYYIT